MPHNQSNSAPAAKYQVLIATASEATNRLLQPLQQVAFSESVPESGGLFQTKRGVVFQGVDYNLVDGIMRARQTEWPYAVIILDVQPGAEAKVEQILSALYHADQSLGIIVLLSEGATLSQPTLDLVTHNSRLTFLQMPATLAHVYQIIKLMVANWISLKKTQDPAASIALAASQAQHAASEAEGSASSLQLEMVGSLASGIAHEFNNVLTVIQSQMDMAMQQAGSLPGVVHLLNQVMETARSASTLSRKLVSFTPDEESHPQAVDLRKAVDEEIALLSKMLGDHITLEAIHSSDIPDVWADEAIISRLIANVAMHARNAMPAGGKLQFTTSKVSHQTGSKYARLFPEAEHGDYAMLSIEDPNPADDNNGSPDPSKVVVALPANLERAASDRLAWIQRTIQAAGGALNVTLLPGMIRMYQMLFPLAKDQPGAAAAAPVQPLALPAEPGAGSVQPATVLVVDDDDTICMIMSQVLATEKHRVLTAKSADEGWQQWCQHRSTIKLLITDINMPGGANGVALGHAIQEQDGSVPVIYTSGHRAVHQFAELEVGHNYLPKPFGMNDLLKVANRALASHGPNGWS